MQTNISHCFINGLLFLGLVICGACSDDSTSTQPAEETNRYTGSNGFVVEGDAHVESLSFDATSVSGISRSVYAPADRVYGTYVELQGRINGKEFTLNLGTTSIGEYITPGEYGWVLSPLSEEQSIHMSYDGLNYYHTEGTTTYTQTDDRLQGHFSGTVFRDGLSNEINISGKFDVEHQIFP